MKYKQNRKLEQITESTLIVGADIGKKVHVARAQDFRGIEYGSRLTFENTHAGFNRLIQWIRTLQDEMKKTTFFSEWNRPVITGCRWLSF
jgi:transposase